MHAVDCVDFPPHASKLALKSYHASIAYALRCYKNPLTKSKKTSANIKAVMVDMRRLNNLI